jgi:fructose-1,6-bisphosphatase/inositol monophosphatase family enzyme
MVELKALGAILLVLLSTLSVADGKIKRVQAGRRYVDHDAVHIVVNKVGYVITSFSSTFCTQESLLFRYMIYASEIFDTVWLMKEAFH